APPIDRPILDGLRTSLHATTLIVAHRISTITLADRVLFLDAGRVAASGSHADLLTTGPAYAALAQAYEEGGVRASGSHADLLTTVPAYAALAQAYEEDEL